MTKELIAGAIAALPEDADAAVAEFLERLASNIRPDNLDLLDQTTLADVASNLFRMRKSRRKGSAAVDVYTPVKDKTEWDIPFTVVDIVVDDMSFVVDSVTSEINRRGFFTEYMIHPVIDGVSCIHIKLEKQIAAEEIPLLTASLKQVLKDVSLANRDYPAMVEVLESMPDIIRNMAGGKKAEREESAALAEYLVQDNFTLLGFAEFEYAGGKYKTAEKRGDGLGILGGGSGDSRLSGPLEGMPSKFPAKSADAVLITKTMQNSSVHRSVPMDVIRFRQFGEGGRVSGEKVFIGLFSSRVYARSALEIPFIRRMVQKVMDASGFDPESDNGSALLHVLEKYRRDELFQIDAKRLQEIALGIMKLQERQRIALYTRKDSLGRFISCLIYVPRRRYDTGLRLVFQRILEEATGGSVNAFYTTLDDSLFARLLVIIDISENKKTPSFDEKALEKVLQESGRSWAENLYDALLDTLRGNKPFMLYARYSDAFPVAYRETYRASRSIHDIMKIEEALKTGVVAPDLYINEEENGVSGTSSSLRLKLYLPENNLSLSQALPLLEGMGLQVTTEMPFEIRPRDCPSVWLHDFLLEFPEAPDAEWVRQIKDNFEDALKRVWQGEAENDGLNRLVLAADMNWREIMILRAYVRYMRQMRLPYSLDLMERTLTDHPEIARLLVDMFVSKLAPGPKKAKDRDYKAEITSALENVYALEQDRIIRAMLNLVEATLRTNYFQSAEDGSPKSYLSIKLRSRDIDNLPEPRPFAEVFVYSPRVEGIHLRGDMIARGGLRWSDRTEDFRTEILGLMKAQMVKNAIIVPVGAKGGFVVKHPPPDEDREAFAKEGVECYQTFICGLLDITDNRTGDNRIIHPKNVAALDGDDPYLVVAADKGTAKFSDIANTLSHRYGFWLGDAFASGGSTGYDHKQMGITARGAWESVKRHFRELGRNIQKEDFDVIGVGDMGGDVFGNGMLLSPHIRLVGAFSYSHIFCDPDPDPETSFLERQRLFDEPGNWDAYDKSKLSRGGMIYSRADKLLRLTPEIRERFAIDSDKVTPAALMRHMLKAQTDLLWFGGIGTYIKASSETHADVGDKSNDSLRIDANELNAKVIGEGANLAITQLGRVEFALRDGKINADFIDNSGGVDTSDNEVNIKILFNAIMSDRNNLLTMGKRNRILEKMSDEIAGFVLCDNYQQAVAISMAESLSVEQMALQSEFIRDLEREQGLSREREGLPSEKEIQARIRAGKGLTRPELAVLLAYAKITFTRDLLASSIPDNEAMDVWLLEAFPEVLREKYAKEIREHRLRREIIATRMANALVNRMGPVFVKSLMLRTNATCSEVAESYLIVLESFGLARLWEEIEALEDTIPAQVQIKMLKEISLLAQNAIDRLLRCPSISPDIAKIPDYRKGINFLAESFERLSGDGPRAEIAARKQEGMNAGLPESLAQKIALVPFLEAGFEIVEIAQNNRADVECTARAYFETGSRFGLKWMREQARALRHDNRWAMDAASCIIQRLYDIQSEITVRILSDRPRKRGCNNVENWSERHSRQTAQFEALYAEMRNAAPADLSMLTVAEQRLRLFIQD